MSKIFSLSFRNVLRYYNNVNLHRIQSRTFLSNAYYCNEVWNSRLQSPIFQKINLDDLYHDLETNYNKTNTISAVDVDIFTNAVQDDSHLDEMLDLVHKLRLCAESCNSLPSTEHAVIRNLVENEHYDRLLQVLDDRLNFGVFLNEYTANLLLDLFWKKHDYISGAKIAGQLMLQEEFSNTFSTYLSLLHLYKFLQNPVGWDVPEPPAEPTDEIKVRVKFIRNPYFDDHFDLKNPLHIIGKTLTLAGPILNDSIGTSFKLIGLALWKPEQARNYLNELKNVQLAKEIINLLPDDNEIKGEALKLNLIDVNVQESLETRIKQAERNCCEKDIFEQCNNYEKWSQDRREALEKQRERLEITERLEKIKEAEAKIKEKELQLWYFDRQEQLELEIESKKVYYPKRWFGKKKKPKQVDESYVPPEVKSYYSKEK